MAANASPTGPLEGIVVADFTRVLAGPYCSMLLGDMGATVIKVESPQGDDTRGWVPPLHEGESTFFLSINRNKQSIVLDLKMPSDLEVARRLISEADVVLENFRPGVMDRLGLGYAEAAELNPAIIYASISGFGSKGGADVPGYDLLVQAMSGLMDVTGHPDTDPFRSGVAVFDVMTGLHIGMGVLAALHYRANTGLGQRIETNLLSVAMSSMVNQTGAYAISGVIPTRMGNAHPSIYPFEPFSTSDGSLVLAVGNDVQFRRLCEAIGEPELAANPLFTTNASRSARRDELRPSLERALLRDTSQGWFERLKVAGVPCGPVQDVAGGVKLAASLGLEPVVTTGAGASELRGIRNPLEFSRSPVGYPRSAPAHGEHSDAIRHRLEKQGEGDELRSVRA